jgi:hypothetical protein
MRAFARVALDATADTLSTQEAAELRAKLVLVNVSLFALSQAGGQQSAYYASRPAAHAEPASSFHLEYDFEKYSPSADSQRHSAAPAGRSEIG